ncbi:epoxide hydrolase 4-like [Daktulosphaira vitifoliae]|uniref:epoxide hydrolase 4-like n=1 Tax=Daktulosphaira vitifoliae TaxID=58002 RepID=UPI0021A9C592|nr:epoxide hydrolase 4-like [Daktulosphaira vitifoliae]
MAKLAESHDNVVCISPIESLKMLAFSLVWGLWIVLKDNLNRLVNAVTRTSVNGKYGQNNRRDSPPSCLTSTVYGTHSNAKIKGVKFHYVECGDPNNAVALLLHGFPSCWISWHQQIPNLSTDFRVIAVDLKGFGDSDKPSSRKGYRVESLINELLMFLSSLGVDANSKCHIIGHDLGALLGWYLVHLRPEYVSKFVSISCPHPNVYWEYLPTSSFFNKNWIYFSQLPYLPEMNALQSDLKIINQCYQHLSKSKEKDDMDYIDAYKYTFSRTEDWTGAINYFRNLPFYRIETSTSNNNNQDVLNVPCLLIVGNNDENVKMESVIKSTEYLKTFTIKIIDNSSHFPHQEQPVAVNKILKSFLVPIRPVINEETSRRTNSGGIVDRFRGLVTSTVQIGSSLKDSMQKRRVLASLALKQLE